jgi:hypothetical protein
MSKHFYALVVWLLALAGTAHAAADPRVVGRWYGQIALESGELLQWINHRRADETYRVEFRTFRSCKAVGHQIESGTWHYENGVLLQIATKVAGQPSHFRDEYRVTTLSAKRLEYTHVASGTRFVAQRVRANFRVPGCSKQKKKPGALTS